MYSNFKPFVLKYKAIKGRDVMSHLKKDFKYHKIFRNKYLDQTYYAYLYRGNERYVPRSGDFIPSHASIPNEFIIYCNNNICRRGSIDNAKQEIKKDFNYILGLNFTLSLDDSYYYPNGKERERGNLMEIAKLIESDENNNPTRKKQAELIRKIYYWNDNFENNFEGFKDFIYDEISFFDSQHYDWVIGDNIIYNRCIRDNEKKRVYCAINNDKVNERFKKVYFSNVSIEPKYKGKLYKQICYLLVNLGDVNNLFVNKSFSQAKELLNDYVNDNMNMNSCFDIYYRKIFETICEISKQYNLKNDSHIAFNEIQKLIKKENEKYKEEIILYEEVAIDLDKNEYSNIVNI